MSILQRYLTQAAKEDLREKMVFLGGPRQVGKTTAACECIAPGLSHAYFNYDKLEHRMKAVRGLWPAEARLIILDEFHKYRKWKSWLKGEWDTQKKRLRFLLTGSARLNIYRRGGDSLQGRYHYYTLHPFSLAELSGIHPEYSVGDSLVFSNKKTSGYCEDLFHYGGFPEPLLKQNRRFQRRWRKDRFECMMREDIRDMTRISDLTTIMLLAEILPERAASILSINSLAEDLQVNFRTVANWLNVFEQFCYCFRIAPYKIREISSVKKEKKLYMWDWSQVPEEGPRFENMIASHLLKFCDFMKEYEGYSVGLNYIRDVFKREIDFVVTLNNKPWFVVETKLRDTIPGRHMYYFHQRFSVPYVYQVVRNSDVDILKDHIRVISADKFLTGLV